MSKRSDILGWQYSIFHGLRSCDQFDDINIVLERSLLAQGEVDYSAIWQLPRNGKSGCGLLVEVPMLEVPLPNSLQRNLLLSVVCVEERNLNTTGMSAEEWGELVLDFLFNWIVAGSSGLAPERRALERARDFVDVMAYRATVSVRREHKPQDRVARPTISIEGTTVTLSCATTNAKIYYTVDGFSFPGPDNTGALPGESAANLYTTPFTAQSGTIVTVCAFKDGLLPSHVKSEVVP